MQALRNSRSIARLILGWFALVLVLSTAAAIAHPKTMQVLCLGSGGTKLVSLDSKTGQPEGSSETGGHAPDCPLCLLLMPPPAIVTPFHAVPPSAGAFFRGIAQRIARAPAPVLPARGPPLIS